jgi:DNA (cytosine-5)-methyltransferase 1
VRFGSLFAGIGGIDLGLERAGMSCAWQVEIDEFCQKVLTKHWPDVPKYGDIRDVGKQNLETVDLIAGGFPCQPFSIAGRGRGAEDNRHLWPEMLRVISELKPTWALGENVPGIIPVFLDKCISDLEGAGYTTEQFTIPACALKAPHRRDRLYIIAYSNSHRSQGINKEAGLKKAESEKWLHIARVAFEVQQGEKDYIPESWVCRGSDGIPDRVDRLKSLGNAVVPQVAEHIGRMIMAAAYREVI